MMKRGETPCSAVTYVKNGGSQFEKCLRSTLFCREHVILDGGSTDETLDLARRYNCRIVPQDRQFLDEAGRIIDFGGIASQACSEAREEWIVLIAADEELEDELVQSMIEVISSGEKGAYFVHRYFLLDGRVMLYSALTPERHIRLCHRKALLGFRKRVHERPILAPGITPKLLPRGRHYIPLTESPAVLKQKYRRYLVLEGQNFSTFGWFRWIRYALRRLIILSVLLFRMMKIRLFHRSADCLPLRYDCLNIWYGWQLIKRSCPASRKREPRLKVVLFSLTGFGNEVLPALLQDPRVNLQAVFTHKYDNPYPYYQEKALVDLCAEKGVIAHFGFPVSSEQGVALLKGYAPDLILISSFREIVKKNVIAIPRKAIINMHSSLLPRYRGVCPTNAVLLRGEKRTGMTVHYVTERIDEGDILLQKELPIDSDETDCTLRKKLALLAGEMVPDIIDLFLGEKLTAGIPQNAALSTPASRPQLEDGFLERYDDLERMERAVRALNPFPGTSFLFEGKRLPVHHAAWLEGTAGEGISRHGETLECWKRGHGLRLW